jgi:hypothetical protein
MPPDALGLERRPTHLPSDDVDACRQQTPTNADSANKYPQCWSSETLPDDPMSHGAGSTGAIPADNTPTPSVDQDLGPAAPRERASAHMALTERPSSETVNSSSSAIMVSRPESRGNDGIGHPVMRHGFGEAYNSEEYLTMLEQVRPVSELILILRCSICTSHSIVMRALPLRSVPIKLYQTIGDLVE